MNADLDTIQKTRSLKELLEFSILNIDKPSGPTSFYTSDFVRKKLKPLGVRKTSHFGTLDPMVTGVLPVALNRACRLTGFFMKKDKTYTGIMRLHEDVSEEKLKDEMQRFFGKIMQKPPVKSRVKRVEREREVKRFEILERGGKDILFLSEVEAGTYIRKLIDDLGKRIGGAHMLELRRAKAGIFNETESFTLYQLDDALEALKIGDESKLRKMLIPGEVVSVIMPSIQVKGESVQQIFTGKPLMKSDILESLPSKDIFAVFYLDRFIAIMRKSDEKEIIARPEFVYN